MRIEKSELKYLFLSFILIAVMGILTNVSSIQAKISSWNPVTQFLTINLGLYAALFLLVKGFSVGSTGKKTWRGALGSILAFLSIDLIMPEYHVSIKEGLIAGGVFGASSTDYFFGYLLNHFIGLTGIALWVGVYFVSFTVLFLLGAFLIDNFIKNQIQ